MRNALKITTDAVILLGFFGVLMVGFTILEANSQPESVSCVAVSNATPLASIPNGVRVCLQSDMQKD